MAFATLACGQVPDEKINIAITKKGGQDKDQAALRTRIYLGSI